MTVKKKQLARERFERFEQVNPHAVGGTSTIRGCIQKFPDWLPGARTANGTAFCHWMQLYRYFVSQSSEFCRYNPLYCSQ
jgi:hypothetical protein